MLDLDIVYTKDKHGQSTGIAGALCCERLMPPRKLHVLEPLSASDGESNIARILLNGKKAKDIFSCKDDRTSDAIAMLFNEDRHWRLVALVGKEKVHMQRLEASSPREFNLLPIQIDSIRIALVRTDALLLEPVWYGAQRRSRATRRDGFQEGLEDRLRGCRAAD